MLCARIEIKIANLHQTSRHRVTNRDPQRVSRIFNQESIKTKENRKKKNEEANGGSEMKNTNTTTESQLQPRNRAHMPSEDPDPLTHLSRKPFNQLGTLGSAVDEL
jgi:hypothetical protein